MEKVGLIMQKIDSEFWKGKCVFITGHTGFKGSWISLWMQSMGVNLHGLSQNPPTTPSLFDVANVGDEMVSTIGDIRDYDTVYKAINACKPDIVIHMAAQSLVRYSYQEPVETYAVNVMGTVNVLEAIRQVGTVKAVVNVTTDKCYENKEWIWGYRENESMGGYDPYSSSKGCSELVTSAYRQSYFQQSGVSLASVRAGNVIGGGDWSTDRLIPDILRSFEKSQPVIIRNPNATRPWQHVLEPLSGYLVLAQHLYIDGQSYAEGWNFGPCEEDVQPVQWIVQRMVELWKCNASWKLDMEKHPHEAGYLKLDISKAKAKLEWQPHWSLPIALENIVDWHNAWLEKADMKAVCIQQIEKYQKNNL